jgi:hypothetical protein
MHGGGVDRTRQRTGATVSARLGARAWVDGLWALPPLLALIVAADADPIRGCSLARATDMTFE